MKKLTANLLLVLACGSAFASPVQEFNTINIGTIKITKDKTGDGTPTPTKGCIKFPFPCDDQ